MTAHSTALAELVGGPKHGQCVRVAVNARGVPLARVLEFPIPISNPEYREDTPSEPEFLSYSLVRYVLVPGYGPLWFYALECT